MKNTVLATLALIASAALISPGAYAGGDPKNGEGLSAVCAACHGADGNSATPMFPKIAGLGENYLHKQLGDIKSGARVVPEMNGILDSMSEQDLQDLAAYFNSKQTQLSGAKDETLALNSGESISALKLGEKVYRAGNASTGVPACTGCHSPRGLGNGPAAYPRLSGQYAAYIEKQLLSFRKGERKNDGEARVMRGVAEHMSEAEIKAVAAYIAGLH